MFTPLSNTFRRVYGQSPVSRPVDETASSGTGFSVLFEIFHQAKGLDVLGCVDLPGEGGAAGWTNPAPVAGVQLFVDLAAGMAGFCNGGIAVNGDVCFSLTR